MANKWTKTSEDTWQLENTKLTILRAEGTYRGSVQYVVGNNGKLIKTKGGNFWLFYKLKEAKAQAELIATGTADEPVIAFGVKKAQGKGTALWTTGGEWMSARFVGLGANHSAKRWKTRAGAYKNASRLGGEVFTITASRLDY